MVSVKRIITLITFIIICLFLQSPILTNADESDIYEKRLALYKKTEALTQLPWYYIAAIDQYERQTLENTADEKVISVSIPPNKWFGIGNILQTEDEELITFFNGIGKDGNGDGVADINNPEDVLYSIAMHIASAGPTEDDIKIGLWNYYKRDLTVQTIKNTAKVFKKYDSIHLKKRDFPVNMNYNYSYNSTWGDRRGFGGLRIHEGTDIFANYGTPVHATTYGVIELMGWNLYGGWRIGIRDIFNIYHYYGHLSGYEDDVKVGQIVEPGDVIGSVGSTGYGPPGTSGKFPPHLHYGMYQDNGKTEWSFDPFPYLKRWEKMAE